MYDLLADTILGLPLWAFIAIIAGAVVLIAIIIAVAVILSKKSKKKDGGEKPAQKADESFANTQSVKEEQPEQKPAEKVEQKPEQKPAENKPAEKVEHKPEQKPAAKTENKPEQKPAVKTESKPAAAKSSNKVYHISKRKDDGMWQIKAAGGGKAIKLFKTQKEAIAYCKTLADNQDASIMIHKEDGSFRKLTY